VYILFACLILFPLYLFCLPIFYVITVLCKYRRPFEDQNHVSGRSNGPTI